MRNTLPKLGLSVVAILAGANAAKAQDSIVSVDFKLRGAVALQASKENLSRKTLGAGLNFGFRLPYGTLNAEVGFQYKPGAQYLNSIYGMGLDPALAPASSTAAAQYIPADPRISVDSRKNQMDGITFRFSYEIPLPADKFGLHAGLQLGGTRFRQEYFGDIGDTSITHRANRPDVVVNWANYEDTYVGVVTHSKIGASLSPFVGVSYRLDENSAFEVNLLFQRYESINYYHIAGSNPGNSQDYTALNKRTETHVEIGYAFRF